MLPSPAHLFYIATYYRPKNVIIIISSRPPLPWKQTDFVVIFLFLYKFLQQRKTSTTSLPPLPHTPHKEAFFYLEIVVVYHHYYHSTLLISTIPHRLLLNWSIPLFFFCCSFLTVLSQCSITTTFMKFKNYAQAYLSILNNLINNCSTTIIH